MNFSRYQIKVAKVTNYSVMDNDLTYPVLTLVGCAGNAASITAKIMRDYFGIISLTTKAELVKELGLILRWVAICCNELKVNMDDVAAGSLKILDGKQFREYDDS